MENRELRRADLSAIVVSAVGKATQGRIPREDIRDDSFLWSAASDLETRRPSLELESIEIVALLCDLESELGIELIVRFDDSVRTVDALVTLCRDSLQVTLPRWPN